VGCNINLCSNLCQGSGVNTFRSTGYGNGRSLRSGCRDSADAVVKIGERTVSEGDTMNDRILFWLKLILGIILILVGIPMLVLPGPGLLFMIMGFYLIITLIPGGKTRVERWRQRYVKWREDRRG